MVDVISSVIQRIRALGRRANSTYPLEEKSQPHGRNAFWVASQTASQEACVEFHKSLFSLFGAATAGREPLLRANVADSDWSCS